MEKYTNEKVKIIIKMGIFLIRSGQEHFNDAVPVSQAINKSNKSITSQ